MNKTIKTRIIHKHAIEANWVKATKFVPKQGEIIVYDDRYIDSDGNEVIVADAIRWKIGDGVTLVNDLPFVDANLITRLESLENIINISDICYYSSFDTALEDINSQTLSGAPNRDVDHICSVYYDLKQNKFVLTLLTDINLDKKYNFTVPTELNLNGKTISVQFTDPTTKMLFATTAALTIQGKVFGSAIQIMLGEDLANSFYGISSSPAGSLTVDGGSYSLWGNPGGGHDILFFSVYGGDNSFIGTDITMHMPGAIQDCYAIYATGVKILQIKNNYIQITSNGVNSVAAGYLVSSAEKLICENNTVFADATNNASIEGSGTSYGGGIGPNVEVAYLTNEILSGTHCGLNISAQKSYIAGGTYTSCSHGGIYYARSNTINYISNATVGYAPYDGAFDSSIFENLMGLGSFYIGGRADSENIRVYMDNCVLTSDPSGTSYGPVVRGTSGEHNNSLYISNTVLPENKLLRVDSGNRTFIGVNTDISMDKIAHTDSVEGIGEIIFTDLTYTEDTVKITDLCYTESEIDTMLQNTPSCISVTHAELKELRDTNQLISGMFYRITDYECTTVQSGTRAMNNKFDIIVQALSSNTLSENASADYHIEDGIYDGYFAISDITQTGNYTLDESVIAEDNRLVEGAVVPVYYSYVDCIGIEYETVESTQDFGKFYDQFIAYDMLPNIDGVVVPVLYKTDPEVDLNPDYTDQFFYVGSETIDGETYDKWRKIEINSESFLTWDSASKVYLYTLPIVSSDNVETTTQIIKKANLPAWELKYSLDNNDAVYSWADTENGKGVIYWMKDEWNNECPYDFKNIQFERNAEWQAEHSDFYEGLNIPEDSTNWFYTFSWINQNYDVEDLTIRQDLLADDGAYGTYNNRIKVSNKNTFEASLYYLPDNLMIDSYYREFGMFYGCHNNILTGASYANSLCSMCTNNFLYDSIANILVISEYGRLECANENVLYQTSYAKLDGCMRNYISGFNIQLQTGCAENSLGGEDIRLEMDCLGNSVTSSVGVVFEPNVHYVDLIGQNSVANVRICSGVNGTDQERLTLTPAPNTPTIYRAAGTQEIILD